MNAIKKYIRRQLLKFADKIYGKYGIRIDPPKLEVHKLDVLEIRGNIQYPVRCPNHQTGQYADKIRNNIVYQIALECEKHGLIEFSVERDRFNIMETTTGSLFVCKKKPSNPVSVSPTPNIPEQPLEN